MAQSPVRGIDNRNDLTLYDAYTRTTQNPHARRPTGNDRDHRPPDNGTTVQKVDSTPSTEKINLSPQAQSHLVQRKIADTVVTALEDTVRGTTTPVASAPDQGKSDYQRSVDTQKDTSTEATTTKVMGAVANAYQTFKTDHPNATSDDFERFQNDVKKGVENGLRDAKGAVEHLAGVDQSITQGINKTGDAVSKQLDHFFVQEAPRYQKMGETGAKPPGTTG